MRHDPEVNELSERLYVLTLTIEETVLNDKIEELSTLFVQRELIIQKLANLGARADHPILIEVQHLDVRIEKAMRAKLEEIRKELNHQHLAAQARLKYGQALITAQK